MNIKCVGSMLKTFGKKIIPSAKKVVEETAPEIEKKVEIPTKELRKGVLAKYIQTPITEMPGKDVEPYMSRYILEEVTKGNNVGAKVVCYPARTVVDMSKKDGSFVRKVFSPDGNFLKKEMRIYPDGSTKSIMPEDYRTGKSIARDANGEITRTKKWQYSGKVDLAHKKFFKDGKQIGGETVTRTPSGSLHPSGTFHDYVQREKVTQYTLPGKRQSTHFVEHHKEGSSIPGQTRITDKRIEELSPETIRFIQ